MAAAIFFVSGGPLCGGPLFFFLCPQGGGGFSVGVLRVWGCLGVYTKSQSIFVVQCLNHTMHQAARVGC